MDVDIGYRDLLKIYKKYGKAIKEISQIDEETEKQVGKSEFPNIDRGKQKKSKENIFLENYQKSYQECVTAFNNIRAAYESVGQRKNDFTEVIDIRDPLLVDHHVTDPDTPVIVAAEDQLVFVMPVLSYRDR